MNFPTFAYGLLPTRARFVGRYSQSIWNQESLVDPDHYDSGQEHPIQGDPSQRGTEQNIQSSVPAHDDVSQLEAYQEYMLRGKEYLGRLV